MQSGLQDAYRGAGWHGSKSHSNMGGCFTTDSDSAVGSFSENVGINLDILHAKHKPQHFPAR